MAARTSTPTTPARRPAPHITWTHTPAGVRASVPSFTTPGATYTVRRLGGRWLCDCKNYGIAHARASTHCKHIVAALASLDEGMCDHCGRSPVVKGMVYCSAGCQAAAIAAELLAFPEPTEPAAFAHCIRCGAKYPFSDEQPLYCGVCAQAARVAA